ncbi:protein of unknown function [Clostridium beijerinckii]|nr:protein of unknown function [Clostridium beijerinckii]
MYDIFSDNTPCLVKYADDPHRKITINGNAIAKIKPFNVIL